MGRCGPAEGGALVADSASHRYADWAAVIEAKTPSACLTADPFWSMTGEANTERICTPTEIGRGRLGTAPAQLLRVAVDRHRRSSSRGDSSLATTISDRGTSSTHPRGVHRAYRSGPITAWLSYQQPTEQSSGGALPWLDRLESEGRFDDALAALARSSTSDWTILAAGDLRLVLRKSDSGVRLRSLFDARAGHEHLPPAPLPLFGITLRTRKQQQVTLEADRGWQQTAIHQSENAVSGDPLADCPRTRIVGNLQVIAQVRFRSCSKRCGAMAVDGGRSEGTMESVASALPAAWKWWRRARIP